MSCQRRRFRRKMTRFLLRQRRNQPRHAVRSRVRCARTSWMPQLSFSRRQPASYATRPSMSARPQRGRPPTAQAASSSAWPLARMTGAREPAFGTDSLRTRSLGTK